jgi:hypothetical protein
MGFKMKPPYKMDPTPVYEVPFDNPDLVAKANKAGTIIVNKDRVGDKKLMDEAMSHEKQHLKDMQDGKLDYDNLSVTFKGKRYDRDSFDEGNENLPWEKRAYAAGRNRKEIDLTPKKNKLTGPPKASDSKKPLKFKLKGGSPFTALDENEVNMNENFGPALELDEIAKQLDKAVVAHKLQAKGVRKHMEEMEDMNKGTALQSPIKMWGAPAFEEGKDTDPSGEPEEQQQFEGTRIRYDSGSNKFGFLNEEGAGMLDDDQLGSLLSNEGIYKRNRRQEFDDQGNLIKTENRANFEQRFKNAAKRLQEAKKTYDNPTTGRNVLKEMYSDPTMEVGGMFIVPGDGYDDSKSYLENLKSSNFASQYYDKDDAVIGRDIKSWDDLKPEDRKRYIEDRRKIKDKDFYDSDAMKEFRKLFPSTNR